MDSLSGITAFVHVAETRSFTEAGRLLEISSSAVGKSVARMEERLGVRLFHRSTRSVTLTTEGELFLQRCKRILGEVKAAQTELLELSGTPRGKVRISVPIQNVMIMPVLAGFMRAYPDIELEVDMSDRMVDVIEEGFDAVIRTGAPQDSRLMARQLGGYRLQVVAAPAYLQRCGVPLHPDDLSRHVCLLHKFPATGMIERWPLRVGDTHIEPQLARALTCTTMDPLTYLAIDGMGIACLPDFSIRQPLADGRLEVLLADYTDHEGSLWMLWPASKQTAPRLRVLIDFFKDHILSA
ncbi:LysR family transcriptional regulator [Pseudomonas sp. dw_358]|uniref:LysR family transcriptional regulator n=1 Tax=Pseudomonas sp. dw_358 TaxID=2720083 RepID=UPI001BD39570|nr:LysR family transcriptional regulator [Pseudomonas sp. dw_358]